MKLLFVVCCVIAVIGIAMFVGCSSENDTDTCMACHSETTTEGKQILGAQAGYDNSGHWLGPRMLVPLATYQATGHLYVFHGSNAPYSNATYYGTACQRCHTHEGFVEYAETGANATAVDETPAPPGCFSCHAPHEQGNFGLRTTTAVTLADGTTTFDEGSGNLCAACHLALSDVIADTQIDPTKFTAKTGPTTSPIAGEDTNIISSHWGPHHGPQADFLMGKNSATADGTKSVHAAGDSCVRCHHYQPDERMAGNLEWGGHGFYLTSEVHGEAKDLLANCKECHAESFKDDSTVVGTAERFLYMAINPSTTDRDWDGDTVDERIFEEIQGMRDTLVSYFGTGTNFIKRIPDPVATPQTYTYANGGTGDGPVVDAEDSTADPVLPANGFEWGQIWALDEAEMSVPQAESFWNFRYFIEDKSMGIHNPTYAAQLLYDAIDNLKTNVTGAAGLPLGDDRPQ